MSPAKLKMDIVGKGVAWQIGRTKEVRRKVYYRIGRLNGEVYLIIDRVKPSPSGTTTKKWIPVALLQEPFMLWEVENRRLDTEIPQFAKYFCMYLPPNRNMPGRVVAVLRKERVLRPKGPVNKRINRGGMLKFRRSVMNPKFSLADFIAAYQKAESIEEPEDVTMKEIFTLETRKGRRASPRKK